MARFYADPAAFEHGENSSILVAAVRPAFPKETAQITASGPLAPPLHFPNHKRFPRARGSVSENRYPFLVGRSLLDIRSTVGLLTIWGSLNDLDV
jgi:hypothetical protein